jgi:hypothetical protein
MSVSRIPSSEPSRVQGNPCVFALNLMTPSIKTLGSVLMRHYGRDMKVASYLNVLPR